MTEKSVPIKIKGTCPTCGAGKFAEILFEDKNTEHDDEGLVWLATTYRVLKCSGCETVYIYKGEVFSEDVDYRYNPATGDSEPYIPIKVEYWPTAPKRAPPEWASDLALQDSDLGNLYDEVYSALNSGMRVLCAIGMRTLFDRGSEVIGIDAEFSFEDKLKELEKKGQISHDERQALTVLIDAGSAAAHRGWRPSPTQIDQLMLITESFLHRSFIAPAAAQTISASVPKRKS